MRSRFDNLSFVNPRPDGHPPRAPEIERLAREYRAVVIGEMIADAIIWCTRAPKRLLRMWRYSRRPRRVPRPEFSRP